MSPYYTKYGLSQKYDEEFREAERYAREHKLNIWADPALTKKYLRLKSKWGQRRSPPATVRRPTVSPATVQTEEWKYVASNTSKVFHRSNCGYVKRISPKNLIGFYSKEAAIGSGRRPCKSCRP